MILVVVSLVGLFCMYLGHEAWVSADRPSDGSPPSPPLDYTRYQSYWTDAP